MATSSPFLCTRRRGPRCLSAAAGVLVALACTDVSPPTAVATPHVTANVVVAGTAAVGGAIEDALDRVTPVLADESSAKPLQMALEDLIEALAHQGAAPTMAALERAEGALNAYAVAVGPNGGDSAELDVIALALAGVRARFGTLN